jgi:hypothetical protein
VLPPNLGNFQQRYDFNANPIFEPFVTGITMNDRSEKIVSLAQELLTTKTGTNFLHESTSASTIGKGASAFKTFLLATLLTAFGSAFTTHTVDQMRRPLTRYERVELDALLYYASILNAQQENALRQNLLNVLARQHMDDLTFVDFRRARSYLLARIS